MCIPQWLAQAEHLQMTKLYGIKIRYASYSSTASVGDKYNLKGKKTSSFVYPNLFAPPARSMMAASPARNKRFHQIYHHQTSEYKHVRIFILNPLSEAQLSGGTCSQH